MRSDRKILYFDEVTSTFEKLLEYSDENVLAVVSKRQTNGIGRLGREWLSDDGGLYFSFYVKAKGVLVNAPFLTIICALASYRTISKYVKCSIKWPNDIVFGGKKLCGILVKSTTFNNKLNVMAGVGINVNNTCFGELSYRATSIKEITNRDYDTRKILNAFLDEFDSIYNNLSNDEIIDEYSKYCITLGSDVSASYINSDQVINGKCIGINTDGTLNIETENGIININAGEVSVRGVYGYV